MASVKTDHRQSRALVARLKKSRIYRDYERAFREATGLPIALRPVQAFDLPHHEDPKENAFCGLMAGSNHSCSACLLHQRKVEEAAQTQPATLKCFAGLFDSSVPVRLGDEVVAFLHTGQILLEPPDRAEFDRAVSQLSPSGPPDNLAELEAAYFQSRVVTRKQYDSILRLLAIFSQQLAALSNQLVMEADDDDSPAITKARAIISRRYAEELSLAEVSRAVNMSAFYFCKKFKQSTGTTFTDFLARMRVEKVKSLLLNPDKRVSEAAYEAGFQSLSQFNRVFRRVAGESPTLYRERLHGRGVPV